MKKYFLILSIILASPFCELNAQKAKDAPSYDEVLDSMAAYNFEAAIELLEEDINKRTKRKKPTEEAENLLNLAHRNLGKLLATERIVIIDSIIVDKKDVLKHIHLSTESGNLQAMREVLNKPDTTDCVMFRNQLDNQAIFAQQDANGRLTLYKSELIGKEWTKPTPLKGIAEEESLADYNYPFMLTDGATLYYAANDEESLGGYDIYMTRYNADDQEFLVPENIGMPFNSPANDYLYVIDEVNNLGWFATDRRQPEDTVCIYVFVPSERRTKYNYEGGDTAAIHNAAKLLSIKETQTDLEEVRAARQRLTLLAYDIRDKKQQTGKSFVIDDLTDYYSESDFQSPEARTLYLRWLETKRSYTEDAARLDNLRSRYHQASKQDKEKMKNQILDLENTVLSAEKSIISMEIEIRNTEIKYLTR